MSIEIKARCADPSRVRGLLRSRGAVYRGLDPQRDTYFRIPCGRLKLREGRIENALIYYCREDRKNSKKCDAVLARYKNTAPLKKILTATLGVLAVVDKKREIFFIRNTKFHIDRVKHLGSFVEIEVFGPSGRKSEAELRKQCEHYRQLFGIKKKDLLADSYSDQLLKTAQRSTRKAQRKS
ncbi:MAG: class IV adenylate cyclase [Candidatus Omnitrophica bacterium]|nr:class IV adenylate cyclase [Candidatus Omnitrophota bacterium]